MGSNGYLRRLSEDPQDASGVEVALGIDEAQQTALACICAALEAQGRPTCKCYVTVGEPMAVTCCECETGVTGEVSIRLDRVYDVDPITMEQILRVRPCRNGTIAAEFVVTLYRCYPTISEDGSVPDPEDQGASAAELNQDAAAIWTALTCCSGLRTVIQELAMDQDPQGGCASLTLRFAAEVSPRADLVTSP